MSDLTAEKLPRLSAHLENYGIDVGLITLNWFLTIFIDAIPTKVCVCMCVCVCVCVLASANTCEMLCIRR